MKRIVTILCSMCLLAAGFCVLTATAAADTTVQHGYPCVIGLPTPDNTGVTFTTTKSVTVVTENGAAVTHCTFTNTGYTAPAEPFPFDCNVAGRPADVTELHISPNGTVALTCVVKPS